MTVVKCQHATPLIHDAVVLDLGDLAAQARQLMERAEAEAAQIIADARAEAARQAKRITDEAREQGTREGREQGLLEGREQARGDVIAAFQPRMEALETDWSNALQEWNDTRSELHMSAREDVLRLVLALAEKVICRAIDHDPTVVQAQVQTTIGMLNERTAPIITVHPNDLELVHEVMPALDAALGGSAQITLRPDDNMQRGGCRVTTQRGEIDGQIDTQLSRIAEALLPDRPSRSSVDAKEDRDG